jgi:hypothetical protein
MVYREIITVWSEMHKKHINTLCGAERRICEFKTSGTYSEHWTPVTLYTFTFLRQRLNRTIYKDPVRTAQ